MAELAVFMTDAQPIGDVDDNFDVCTMELQRRSPPNGGVFFGMEVATSRYTWGH
jgi:hypothetical protein